jgi:hypothetical protein
VQVAIEQGRHAAAELVKQETENKAYKQANEARFISRIPECTEFDTLYATTVATIMSNTNATNVYIALMELGEDDLVWPVIPPDPDTPEGAEGEKPPEPEPPKEEPEEGEEGEEKTADIFQEKPPPEINRNAYLRYASCRISASITTRPLGELGILHVPFLPGTSSPMMPTSS